MRPVARASLVVLALAALAVGGFFAVGPERIWARIADADQGPVDVAHLRRRTVPNDSLACSTGFCARKADFALPVYAVAPSALMAALDAAVLADPDVSRVDDGSRADYRRYVARTPIMRFPDTVDALAGPAGKGAGLVLYSRSLFGRGDWGANRERLEGWAKALGARMRALPREMAPATS